MGRYLYFVDDWMTFELFILILQPKIVLKNVVFRLSSRKQLLQLYYIDHFSNSISIFRFPIEPSKGPGWNKNSEKNASLEIDITDPYRAYPLNYNFP